MSTEDSTHEHDAETKAIGDLIDALGIEASVGPGELVSGAIVILKVVQADGSTRLSMVPSDGLGWIERAGMLRVAEQMEATSGFAGND